MFFRHFEGIGMENGVTWRYYSMLLVLESWTCELSPSESFWQPLQICPAKMVPKWSKYIKMCQVAQSNTPHLSSFKRVSRMPNSVELDGSGDHGPGVATILSRWRGLDRIGRGWLYIVSSCFISFSCNSSCNATPGPFKHLYCTASWSQLNALKTSDLRVNQRTYTWMRPVRLRITKVPSTKPQLGDSPDSLSWSLSSIKAYQCAATVRHIFADEGT